MELEFLGVDVEIQKEDERKDNKVATIITTITMIVPSASISKTN